GLAAWRPRRGELRVGFRGPHGRLPGTCEGHRHAGGRGRSAIYPQGRCHQRGARQGNGRSARPRQAGRQARQDDRKDRRSRMNKYYEEVCLYEQPFIKENTTTVADLIKAKIAKLGENISVSRFVRFKVGEAVQIEETAETAPPAE